MRTELQVLLGLTLATISLIEFVLSHIPEFFQGGAALGTIISRICLSYVSSYIFYFFVVHAKSQRDKDNIYGYIAKKSDRIIGNAKSLIGSLKTESKHDFESEYPNLDDTQEMCKLVNPHGQAPLVLGRLGNYANWIQYLDYYRTRTEETIVKVYTQLPFLDSDYLKLIVAIEDCTHFMVISSVAGHMPIKNTDLSAFSKGMQEYFESVKALEEYAKRKFQNYK